MGEDLEWLEADGLGGFASGPALGPRTRRYHALLLVAATPPTGRLVLVNGLEAWVEGDAGRLPLTTQRYAPDTVTPAAGQARFQAEPWPSWTTRLPDGTAVRHELLVAPGTGETVLRWERVAGTGACRLGVRLLLSGRDYHALHQANPGFRFDAHTSDGPASGDGPPTADGLATADGPASGDGNVCWRPYPDLPAIAALSNGRYAHDPCWYYRFRYAAEQARGLDDTEDLASPGVLGFDLAAGPALVVLRSGDGLAVEAAAHAATLMAAERERRAGLPPLLRAAQAYGAVRGAGRTLIAGFPWFTDWGRDTFIALRGLLLATGQLAGAEAILLEWAGTVSEGMLPNRFPDAGQAPEFNAVDASLWFVVAVHDVLEACAAAGRAVAAGVADRLQAACAAILDGYAAGTRFGIAADADGLLRAGVPGLQLTWMDAVTQGRVVTPRIGKPVEVQALWINALRIGARWSGRWAGLERRATSSFARFANPAGGLLDVIDVDHVPGTQDAALRPNQILAVGGLPFPLLEGAAAQGVVARVEARLLTPLGLRTLDPADPAYVGRYRGGPAERDGAYHQGTAWPWLMGPFVEAWLRGRGRDAAAKAEAAARFLAPLERHLGQAGLGHVSEVVDGDAPHTPGGCPFQAWSLGELLRIRAMVAQG